MRGSIFSLVRVVVTTSASVLVAGSMYAADAGYCPVTIHNMGEWTRRGGGSQITHCRKVGVPPVEVESCDTYDVAQYQNESGERRTYNCSLGEWS